MLETLLDLFQCSPLSAWGPFVILLLCGLGLPIPEDIVLIAAGALGVLDERPWIEISLLMYAGVLGGDSFIFAAGRFYGGRLRTSRWFQRFLSPAKQQQVEAFFQRHGATGLFIGRFLPGLRAPLFFTAGSMRVPYVTLVLFDGAAALVSVPAFVWLGHWLWSVLQDDLEQINRLLAAAETLITWSVVLIALGTAAFSWSRRTRKNLPNPEPGCTK